MILCLAMPSAGIDEPVAVRQGMETAGDSVVGISFRLDIRNGWHVYSLNLPADGPVSASITIDSLKGLKPAGELEFSGDEQEKDDAVFGMRVRYFEKSVTFRQKFLRTDDDWYVCGYMTYAACNDESCIPPQNVDFEYRAAAGHATVAASAATDDAHVAGLDDIPGYDALTWAPAEYDREAGTGQKNGLWGLFLTSLLGGLLALLTPCVWPVIPMTVSFFLKRAGNRRSAVRDAILYGVSIVAVYVSVGLLVTLVFGANALNSLSTNAVVNLFFFAMLVVFALSFFGLFDITLPSEWSTGLTHKSTANNGFTGIFLMALTLSIVSFSCTGPIIGFLLVDAASTGGLAAPLVGMLGFSVALSVPFALFAVFPHWLKSLPKSGGWMEKVKVSLAFIELAFSLKFLSVADMAYGWGILPRDLFVLLWIVMAILAGLYLLGIIRFHKDEPKSAPGWLSVAVALVFLAFAAWMVPGLWGKPLSAISAFTPPMSTQRISISHNNVEPDATDYTQGIELSASTGKPMLVDFTGYGCVNCRKMEATVWTDPAVASMIHDNYILVSLFVDDKTPLDSTVSIVENGKTVRIRTVGDKWSLLQRLKFGANAQPFYVIVNSQGRMLAGPYVFDPDAAHFLKFLKSGL